MIEGLSPATIAFFVNAFGLPGMIFIIWYADQKRLERVLRQYKEDLNAVLTKYREDMVQLDRRYENNVVLVEGYEKLAGELASIIQLNTQVQTKLVERVSSLRKEPPR